jgi:hypothetical protein
MSISPRVEKKGKSILPDKVVPKFTLHPLPVICFQVSSINYKARLEIPTLGNLSRLVLGDCCIAAHFYPLFYIFHRSPKLKGLTVKFKMIIHAPPSLVHDIGLVNSCRNINGGFEHPSMQSAIQASNRRSRVIRVSSESRYVVAKMIQGSVHWCRRCCPLA